MVVVELVALRPARRRAVRQATELGVSIRFQFPLRQHRRRPDSSQRDGFQQPGLVNMRAILKTPSQPFVVFDFSGLCRLNAVIFAYHE
jgi:hypothetical protein